MSHFSRSRKQHENHRFIDFFLRENRSASFQRMFVLSKEGRRGVMVHDCVGSVSERKKEAGECVLFEGDTIAIIYPPCTYAFPNVNVDEGKSDAHIRLSSRMANRFRDVCGTYRSFVCVCVFVGERRNGRISSRIPHKLSEWQ